MQFGAPALFMMQPGAAFFATIPVEEVNRRVRNHCEQRLGTQGR